MAAGGRHWWGAVTAVALGAALIAAAGPPAVGATTPWPSHPDWASYVRAPRHNDVGPVAVVATSGPVTDADALVSGHGQATLIDRAGAPSPSLVLDYGEDVGGTPYFDVKAVTGTPTLSAAYSEGRQYLGPKGDLAPSASSAGDEARSDTLIVAYPGLLTTGLIQGGERFERISLTTPGRLILAAAGIEFSAVRATPGAYRGWFDSSSPLLNRIWFDGAYTTQLDEIPANSVPPAWQIVDGALRTVQGSPNQLAGSSQWSNYSMSVQTRVVTKDSGWLVRSNSNSSGYLLLLRSDADPDDGASLTEVVLGPHAFVPISTVSLPGVDVARWVTVTTSVEGATVATSINGREVARFNSLALGSGVPIWRNGGIGLDALGSTAMFRRLVVREGSAILSRNALSHRSDLVNDFPGPDVISPDRVATIVDGAKRDRVVWSGDLGVEAPTDFVSTDNQAVIAGSLRLLASYQQSDGAMGTNVDPTVPLGTFPQPIAAYSASYSIDVVNDIATDYLYTGDLALVRNLWPAISRELAYDRSLVDHRGLLVTNDSDGQDWDYYDGSKVGEVTAYNDDYYEALDNAATMAKALGQVDEAKLYRFSAAVLRSDINRYLFNPNLGVYEMTNLEPDVVAQDASSLAVEFGIAPEGNDIAILDRLNALLPATPYGPEAFTANSTYRTQVSPFVANDEVAALFNTGQSNAALTLIDELWGHMDAPGPDDSQADWELVSADGEPGFGSNTSLAHGWASGATALLSTQVLGISPTAAGFATWTVEPHPGSLHWAEGEVPTPAGAIRVSWAHNTLTGSFSLAMSAPRGTKGTIVVPVPSDGATLTWSYRGRMTTIGVPRGRENATVAVVGGSRINLEVRPI